MMVSKRNFVSICIMMGVILLMFQFLLVVRDVGNDPEVNPYLEEDVKKTKEDAWSQEALSESGGIANNGCVVYVGSPDSPIAKTVKQWAEYTKLSYFECGSLEEYGRGDGKKPVLLCVAGSEISTTDDVEILSGLMYDAQPILFADLPPVETVEKFPGLMKILGIRKVMAREQQLTGVKLFEGFLLGGEVIYVPKNDREQQMQDLDLDIPWYLTIRGTKSYMVGMLDDPSVTNESLPPIIWRSSYANSQAFAVNGDYMYDQTGIGILDAMVYELSDYEVHPVVNAQNLSIVNYPSLAVENTDLLMGIYARTLSRLQMDLMWPSLIACANKSDYKMTCFMTPQLDYSYTDDEMSEDLPFYLKQFNEQEAEAGLSLDSLPGATLAEKADVDDGYFRNSGSAHKYGSVYIGENSPEEFIGVSSKGVYSDVRTVTGICRENDRVLSYCSDGITEQCITADGFTHTFSQDLKIRSLETALGYSNILLDMSKITAPKEGSQYWEVLFEVFSSNINTYWNPFLQFEKTTLAESDERVREFLSLDYGVSRSGDRIRIDVSGNESNAWFVLRTRSETVRSISGGEYQKIEDGAYLICAEENTVEVELRPSGTPGIKLP